MKAAAVVLVVGLCGCSLTPEAVESKKRSDRLVNECFALGGSPTTHALRGYEVYIGCDFALVRERERQAERKKNEPSLGTGTGRWEQ